jgi:hypothetical protein
MDAKTRIAWVVNSEERYGLRASTTLRGSKSFDSIFIAYAPDFAEKGSVTGTSILE